MEKVLVFFIFVIIAIILISILSTNKVKGGNRVEQKDRVYFPVTPNETFLNMIMQDGLKISRDTKHTVINTSSPQCAAVCIESDGIKTKFDEKIILSDRYEEFTQSKYIERVGKLLTKLYNNHKLVISDYLNNKDVINADGKLNNYTRTKNIKIDDKNYVLFIQIDILCYVQDVCFTDTLEMPDKLETFINMYEEIYKIKIGKDYYKFVEIMPNKCLETMNYIEKEKYYKFANEIIKDCYKFPSIKQKIYINLFVESENNIIPLKTPTKKLLLQVNDFIEKELFSMYYKNDIQKSPYYAYIRLDRSFKITAEYLPNVGNVDAKIYEIANSISLTEYIYGFDIIRDIKYPLYVKNNNIVKGSGYKTLEAKLSEVSDTDIINANKVLATKPKIIYVAMEVSYRFIFITSCFHYFEFCYNKPDSFTLPNKSYITTHDDDKTYSYYRIMSKKLPYALLKFSKLWPENKDDNPILSMRPTYRINLVSGNITLPYIPDIVFTLADESYCRKTIKTDKYVYMYVVRNIPYPNIHGGIFDYYEFQEESFVMWIENISVYNAVKEGRIIKGNNTEPYTPVMFCNIDDTSELLEQLELFKDYFLKNRINKTNGYTMSIKRTYGLALATMHFKIESNKNPFYTSVHFDNNTLATKYRIMYDNIFYTNLKIAPDYYRNYTCTLYNLVNLNAYFNQNIIDANNHKKFILTSKDIKTIGRGSHSNEMTDQEVISSYDELYNITYDEFLDGSSKTTATEYITFGKNKLYIMEDIIEYIKKFYINLDGLRFYPQTYIGIKNRFIITKLTNDVLKKYGDGSAVIVSTRCGTTCGYVYDNKIDLMRIKPHNTTSNSEQYQKEVMEKHGKKFNKVYGSYYEQNSDKLENSYMLIILELMILNKVCKERGLIVGYELILDVITKTQEILNNLKKGGTFIASINIIFPTNIFKQYISNLTESFKKVEYSFINYYVNFYCYDYKGSFSTIKDITSIDINYNYYGFNEPKTTKIPSIKNPNISKIAKVISNDIELHIKKIYNTVKYNSYIEWNDEDYKKLVYDELNEIIRIMEEYNIPYDPYYSSIVTKYHKDVYNKIIKFDPTINSLLLNYNKLPLVVNRNCDRYHYDYSFAAQYMKLNALYDFIESDDKANKEMNYIYRDFAKGVSIYLMKNKIFKTRVSNAFVKLWEIYNTHKVLDISGINAFHMCEAPGQWINTTKTYIDKIYGEDSIIYNWIANSLNPNNEENIKKYGNDIINDTYGFMKNNKEKWIFGDDGTGDITKSYNILWYREHLKDKNINLVTGDAGLPTDMPLEYLQKLDYAQCVLTLATSSKGANCVIKCFSPYMKNNNKTLESTGFFVNLIYLYYCCFEKLYLYKPYTSRSQGGEFYIVGISFTYISEENLKQLLDVLDNFKENINFICKKDMSDKFEVLIENFLQQLVMYNTESLKMAFFLNQMINDESDALQFKKFISKDEVIKIQNNRFETFCKKFNLK